MSSTDELPDVDGLDDSLDVETDRAIDAVIDAVPLPREDPEDGVQYSGKFAADARVELGQVLKDMQAQAKKATEAFKLNTDTDYYLCLCFVSREQKQEFLNLLALADLGERFLSGVEVAKRLGVKLTPVAYTPHVGKADKKLADIVLGDEEYGIGID